MRLTVIVLVLFSSAMVLAANHTVTMKSISYDPKVIEVKVGDSIQWENKSFTEHSATSYENEKQNLKFDTGLVQPKAVSKEIKFHEVGTYSYHCSVHGKTMTGKINVIQ